MVKSFFLFQFILIIIKNSVSNSESNNFGITPFFNKKNENQLKNYNFKNHNDKDKIIKLGSIKKNLVIGAIVNYKWDKVKVFFGSYYLAKFENCDCIMFVANMPKNTIRKMKSCGVIVYPIPDKYINIPIRSSRWKIYGDYLNDNPGKYNLVFTADIRDTFFQSDFFNFYNSTKPFLGVAIEDGTLTEFYNKNWLINTYGEDLYKTMANERIICVGTIWGTPDKFGEFSKVMGEKLCSEWSYRLNVINQAVGNYLIYHDKMFSDCLVRSYNVDGFAMTIGLKKREDIILDKNNNILNGNGLVGAVIHQYDRFPDLINIAILKYCPISQLYKFINIIAIFLCIVVFKFKRYISKSHSSLSSSLNCLEKQVKI